MRVAICKHIRPDGFGGHNCELSGCSVDRDCGTERDRVVAEDSSRCIPRLALAYVLGDREVVATVDRMEREAIAATAATIERRIAAGLIDGNGIAAAEREETRHVATETRHDLSKMSVQELQELALAVKTMARERERAEKQRQWARPALEAEAKGCAARVFAINNALRDLDAGKTVDLKALGVKIARGGTPSGGRRGGPRSGSGGTGWTPERRLTMALNAVRVSAKRHGWSPDRLAAAEAKARAKVREG